MDASAIIAEIEWLKEHPHFDQKPASVLEFLGPDYLDIEKKVRPGLKKALADIFGHEVNGKRIANFEQAMITGGIGIGKTTFASIALPYMVHWVLCLRDPQDYFELLPGSRIAFMQMSTSEDQALQVIFGDIKARVNHSPWFQDNAPIDSNYKKQIRFPGKDIWILPGDSAETTFEGYNILAGILDEMDSHKTTKDKDYADVGFDTINSRIASRFIDEETNGHKGLLMCIGQMKKGNGFAARKYEEMQANDRAYTMRMTIWESLGWHRFCKDNGEHDSFWYDIKRKKTIPEGIVAELDNPDMIEVPKAYEQQFMNNPEKALRDLAGIPPKTSDPFISLTDKIDLCVEKWHVDQPESPVGTSPTRVEYAPWFKSNGDPRRRAVHIDLAKGADNGDAVGITMGHIDRLVETDDGELKPYIILDCLIRLKAMPGTEIILADIRRIIYYLKEELKFRIIDVTMDGYQSTDTMQQLRKKKYRVNYLSMDKSTLPYEDLREAIYEERLEFPRYMTFLKKGDSTLVQIAVSELQQLSDTGRKIDHPPNGSKDVADSMAGVVHTLMGDRSYRRGAPRPGADGRLTDTEADLFVGTRDTSMDDAMSGMRAPVVPTGLGDVMGFSIPDRLRPR